MIASQGILTSAGGTNSHAAVVARGEGIPAVCGADAIKIDLDARAFTANGTTVREGDTITIDALRHQLRVALSERELTNRKALWKAPAPRYTAGVLAKYARLVSSSSIGAVTDG